MEVRLIEYSHGEVYYGCEGKAFCLAVTESMCCLSLGEAVQEINDYAGNGMHPFQVVENVWVYPEPTRLLDDQAIAVAMEHHQLARELSQDEIAEFGIVEPAFLFYLK